MSNLEGSKESIQEQGTNHQEKDSNNNYDKLTLSFHGRIIDHLGIQMYQSPVAAIAELVSNAWDAEAKQVKIDLPETINEQAEIIISDDGIGMTFEECQKRYLNVGYDRRQSTPQKKSPNLNRPILGRKGIGKFAGFGIAGIITVSTVSERTGEKTVFSLELDRLRGDGNSYMAAPLEIDVLEYLPPDEGRKIESGTRIVLKQLNLCKKPSCEVFMKSMARRFLLHQRAADFKVLVNSNELPTTEDLEKIEFVFPREYNDQLPDGITINNKGWAEELVNGHLIRWQFVFYKDPIDEEELRGISVFANGKLAQNPFIFNIVGGIGGQQGIEYLSGQIEADFLDELNIDIISTERQRVNWEHPEAQPLLEWGQERLKKLLKKWQAKRAENRLNMLNARIMPFTQRLANLPGYENKVVKRALIKLAGISSINEAQFVDLGEAILTAWEGGRLKDLVDKLADTTDMSEASFVQLLLEANALTAIHMAEAIHTKLTAIKGLETKIITAQRENAIRNYISNNPWLISPEWDTFQIERHIKNFIEDIADNVGFNKEPDWAGRIDLCLSSGDQLLVLEFMRPGIQVDWDHINRFQRYILTIRTRLRANTGNKFSSVLGYLIADKLHKSPEVIEQLDMIATQKMWAMDWEHLLRRAKDQWKDFLGVMQERAPNDERVKAINLSVQQAAASQTPELKNDQ